MSNPSASSAEIDKFVPPDILRYNCRFNDIARMFYDYRDVMDYNSRLILIFAKNPPPEHSPEASGVPRLLRKIEPYYITLMKQIDKDYSLVTVLLSTRNKELTHLDKHIVTDNPAVILSNIKELYSEQVKKERLCWGKRNFHVIHICIGNEIYNFDARHKLHDSTFNRYESYKVQEHLLDFIREEEVIDTIEYARQSYAYYNTELPKLLKFINANLEMILADVGDPELLRLLEEDRDNDIYRFITRKEQLLRIKIKEKEELEAVLRRLDAEIKSMESEN